MIDIRTVYPALPDDAIVYACSPTFTAALTHVRNGECNMAYASQGRVTRAVLVALWSKPFLELGLRAVHGYTPITNMKALEFAYGMGGAVGARLCPPGHVHFVMLRKQCQWLPENKHLKR